MSHDDYADGTDRQTDGRQTVTLRFPLDVASVIKLAAVRSTITSLMMEIGFIMDVGYTILSFIKCSRYAFICNVSCLV